MRKVKITLTVVLLIYLFVVFWIFYRIDKRMLDVFCAVGTSLYVALLNRFAIK